MRRELKYHAILFDINHAYIGHNNFTSYGAAAEWVRHSPAVVAEIHDRREILFSGNHDCSLITTYKKRDRIHAHTQERRKIT